MNEEFCIMHDNPPLWRNFRYAGSERHEIFEGRTGNRKKSIEDGLVIFTTPQIHRTNKDSIHNNGKKWLWLKEEAERVWIEYYSKDKEEFMKRYGRNYI